MAGMIKRLVLGGVFCLSLFSCSWIMAQEKMIPVVVDGDEVSYLSQENTILAKGNVSLKYKEITITCDEAAYNTKNNQAQIKGNVVILSKKGKIKAEQAVYDFARKTADIKKIRVEADPVYGYAETGQGLSEKEYLLEKGYVTTCDLEDPHYRLKAKKIYVYPDEKIVARNVTLYLGKLPVFYIPYYSQPLNDTSFPVEVSPGKDSDWGYYALTRWRYSLNDASRGKVLLDVYEDRGLGTGITHKSDKLSFGEVLINGYYIDDQLYSLDKRNELFDLYPERAGIADKYLEDDRYKGQVSYSWQPSSDLSLRGEFHKFSDEYFMKDFFYREYEIEPHPYSYFLVDKSFANSSLSLLTQKRANQFYTETEYLPKLDYSLYKQRLGEGLSLFIRSDISLANLTAKTANSDLDDDASRLHAHNRLSYESRMGWLIVNPYAGLYTTYYSKNLFAAEDVLRNAPEAGITLSTEFSKIFDQSAEILGLDYDKFRHLIRPELTFAYIHDPTVSSSNLFQFDDIDSLVRKESLIFELKNKLQAKQGDSIRDLVYFSPAAEYIFDQEGKGSYFDNLTFDLEIYPGQYLALTSDSIYDCEDRAFREANVDVSFFTPDEKYSVGLGHRYARDESSQTTMSSSLKLSPKWTFNHYLRYEFKTGDFKEQEYVFHRDLHCWLMDLGINVDEDKNYTLWVMFKIKAFPQIHMGMDHGFRGGRKSY